ncbi:MAG: L-arabinose isomerase [Spirochaetes bacterium]|jgi:L-arabinose isomerase|nr:L-arabinose isomerase [Spirochaetota bacterium]
MNIEKLYKESCIWFVTGSQHLYGDDIFSKINENSAQICTTLNNSEKIPVKIIYKSLLTDAGQITQLMHEANSDETCVGIIMWMHTFSPAKMWISGLTKAQKPLLHLHTQFNRDLPFETIDMDFMNLNQSAHGDREFGFINTRLGINREVVAGHYTEDGVQQNIGNWSRVAVAWKDSQQTKVARFGDNMRNVAVTEGDKIEAQIRFGYRVDGFGVGDLTEYVDAVTAAEAEELIEEYQSRYSIDARLLKGGDEHASLIYAARQERGIENFLNEGGYSSFTTTFEDLHGLDQLPGLACQRLMEKGFGFGAEGDWKTAALLHTAKVIAFGNDNGTSFMEDYTYHLEPSNQIVLGAHMLEICPSIAMQKPAITIQPLGIGGKNPPVRMIFDTAPGKAINASLIDLGNRFRLIVNNVAAVEPRDLPNLPVARVLLKPEPDLKTSTTAWILAGGAHHTVFTKSVTNEQFCMFARMAGIEIITIDQNTDLNQFRTTLKLNEIYHGLQTLF